MTRLSSVVDDLHLGPRDGSAKSLCEGGHSAGVPGQRHGLLIGGGVRSHHPLVSVRMKMEVTSTRSGHSTEAVCLVSWFARTRLVKLHQGA